MEEGSVTEEGSNQLLEESKTEIATFSETFNFECDEIVSVEDLSDEFFKRARVLFKNTYELSIVSGLFAYGNDDQFEIAILDPAGEFATEEVLGVNNCVVGHLSIEEIVEIIQFVGDWKLRIEDETQNLLIEAKQNQIEK